MKQKLSILTAALICIVVFPVLASAQIMNEHQKQIMQQRVKDKVEEFQNHLSNIVNHDLTNNKRQSSLDLACALFIGNGESYTVIEKVVDRNTGATRNKEVLYSAPLMQVSSINSSRISSQPVKKYLKRQYDAAKAAEIEIKWVDSVYVTSPKPDPRVPGRFVCTATIKQGYVRKVGDHIQYGPEVTTKDIVVYLDYKDIPGGESFYDAKLADVYVVETKKATFL